MRKTTILFIKTALLSLSVLSCDKSLMPDRSSTNLIRAEISTSSMQTKTGISGSEGRLIGSYPLDGPGVDSLCVAVYEFDNHDLPGGLSDYAASQTKGQVVSTGSISRFSLKAWLESTNRYDPVNHPEQLSDGRVYDPEDANDYRVIPGATVTRSGSDWNMNDSYYWRNMVPTNFWAVYPDTISSTYLTLHEPGVRAGDAEQKTFAVDYRLPAPSADFSDAENQPDLCFAYSRKTWDESVAGNDDMVHIDFKHALSAIYFDISDVLNSISVKKIGFNNVPSAAHCGITGTPGASAGNPGEPVISWSGHSTPMDYRQSYQNSDFDVNKILDFNGSSKVFMMIPHTLDADTEMWAEFEVKGATVSRSVRISNASSGNPVVWKPGMKYLYKIMFRGLDDYTFHIDESGSPISADKSFTNTVSPESITIPLVSAAVDADNVRKDDVEWTIKSVQAGTSSPQEINAASFSGIGNLSASGSGVNLTITADARESVYPGSHDYWANTTGRTNHLDWSPEDWSSKGVIDLSKYDFQDETADNPMTTANCYVIRHAGTYKLPLVYGNGIVNGAFNVESYAPTMAAGGQATYFLPNFKNHLDKDIFSPFIEYNTRNGNPSAHDFITPAGCEIVWQDEADIITVNGIAKESVTVRNASGNNETFQVSYMTFTIPQDKICQNNAIIALKDDRGDTIWSWHIWTTNDPSLLQPDIPIKNQTGVTYKLFPMYSIGWVDTNSYMDRENVTLVLEQKSSGKTITLTVRQPEVRGLSNGCYYEFGRKDPFPRNQDNTPDGSGNFSVVQSNSTTLGTAIRNPGTFYHQSGSALAWMSGTGYYNLWTGRYCDIAHVDEGPQLIKTIYDPSPKGYKIPASNAFTGFSRTNVEGPFVYGFNFKTGTGSEPATVFFAASGYRNFSNGNVGGLGSEGYYWVSIPSGADVAYQLGFVSAAPVLPRVEPKYSHARSYCYNVRPVTED